LKETSPGEAKEQRHIWDGLVTYTASQSNARRGFEFHSEQSGEVVCPVWEKLARIC